MNPHPSGRPVPKENRRDYSMRSSWGKGYVLPRLNQPERPEHDTHAVGFIQYPPEDTFWHGMEARRK